ncbi:hypothetical protein [Paraburkholderia sp. BCC1885]|uniref:hypothetical protein n=1 Tax=Paraburkholderia sp. BCC1885 TaxID=2562669 RepID=UPI0011845167|nr:hypothetical protein [Paraburkholderia sp. BCC1885]
MFMQLSPTILESSLILGITNYLRSRIGRERSRRALQDDGGGATAMDKQGRLADMLRISMPIEILSIGEVMRVYQVVTTAELDSQFRTTVRSMSTGKPDK